MLCIGSPFSFDNFEFGRLGVFIGLQFIMLFLLRMFRIYLDWFMYIEASRLYLIFIPKKYLKMP